MIWHSNPENISNTMALELRLKHGKVFDSTQRRKCNAIDLNVIYTPLYPDDQSEIATNFFAIL
jgi:hypothetical protein